MIPREYVITERLLDSFPAGYEADWRERTIWRGRDRKQAFLALAANRVHDVGPTGPEAFRNRGQSLRRTVLNVYCDGEER